MNLRGVRSKMIVAVSTAALAGLVATAAPANAAPSTHSASTLRGNTAVTTAPGIAVTLIRNGVLPLPILPRTGFSLGFNGGLTATYRFPITGGNPSLSPLGGDILHAGGIDFVSLRGGHLAVSNFDIDLNTATVYATKVNGASARVAILNLDASTIQVASKNGATVVTVKVTLAADAAAALKQYVGLNLPAGLPFGTAVVTLRS